MRRVRHAVAQAHRRRLQQSPGRALSTLAARNYLKKSQLQRIGRKWIGPCVERGSFPSVAGRRFWHPLRGPEGAYGARTDCSRPEYAFGQPIGFTSCGGSRNVPLARRDVLDFRWRFCERLVALPGPTALHWARARGGACSGSRRCRVLARGGLPGADQRPAGDYRTKRQDLRAGRGHHGLRHHGDGCRRGPGDGYGYRPALGAVLRIGPGIRHGGRRRHGSGLHRDHLGR